MLLLGVLSDLHGNLASLKRVLTAFEAWPIQGFLAVGDIGKYGHYPIEAKAEDDLHLASVSSMLSTIEATRLPFLWVPGNHDRPDLPFQGNADRRLCKIAGLRVFGIGGSPLYSGWPYEWEEAEVRGLSLPPFDILLTHTPPAHTSLDRLRLSGRSVGSEAVREIALNHQGFLLCGHIHESVGSELLGDCLCLNVGSLGAPYARLQAGLLRRDQEGDHVAHIDLTTDTIRWWSRALLEKEKPSEKDPPS